MTPPDEVTQHQLASAKEDREDLWDVVWGNRALMRQLRRDMMRWGGAVAAAIISLLGGILATLLSVVL